MQIAQEDEVLSKKYPLKTMLLDISVFRLLFSNKLLLTFFIEKLNIQADQFLETIKTKTITKEGILIVENFLSELARIYHITKSNRCISMERFKKVRDLINPRTLVIKTLKRIISFTETTNIETPPNSTLNNLYIKLTLFSNLLKRYKRDYKEAKELLNKLRKLIDNQSRKQQTDPKESNIFALLAEFGTLREGRDTINYESFFGVKPQAIYQLGLEEGYDLETIGAYNFLDGSEIDRENLNNWVQQLKSLSWYSEVEKDVTLLLLHLENQETREAREAFRNIRIHLLRRYFQQDSEEIQKLLSHYDVSTLSEAVKLLNIPFAERFELVKALKRGQASSSSTSSSMLDDREIA